MHHQILNLGYDLPAAPHGFCLIGQLILNDILRIQSCIKDLEPSLESMRYALLQLADEDKSVHPYHSWSSQESVLKRLKRYLQLAAIYITPDEGNAPLTSLRHYVESIERQIRDFFFTSEADGSPKACKEKIQRLTTTSLNIARHYSLWIRTFDEDEHLLLYLIQKKQDIVDNFSHAFFEELVIGGFGTPGEISDLLLQKFNARGFTNLLPSIRNLLASL